MSAPAARKVLIIGSGMAGPVLAMFLRRAGVEATVYEGYPAPRDEIGAFFNLAPNGLDVLRTLGVKDDIVALGTWSTAIGFLNHKGRELARNPDATLLIKRGLLNRGLREAAERAGVTIEFGKRLVDITDEPGGPVVAHFEDGTQASGDLLVGCDGGQSRTRRLIMPEAPAPVYTGVIDCGAFAHTSALATPVPPSGGLMTMTFGLRGGFFGYQVLDSGEVYWFNNYIQAEEPDREALEAIPLPEWRAVLAELHAEDHHPIPALIAATDGGIGRWPIYDLPTLPTWHRGRVLLIGDAAHLTSPHVGQGASLAMEDAIVLARCLRDTASTGEAFTVFEGQRKARVDKIVKEGRRTGSRKGPSSAFARGVRDLVLPFFLKLGVRTTQKFYSYHVDWDEPAVLAAR